MNKFLHGGSLSSSDGLVLLVERTSILQKMFAKNDAAATGSNVDSQIDGEVRMRFVAIDQFHRRDRVIAP